MLGDQNNQKKQNQQSKASCHSYCSLKAMLILIAVSLLAAYGLYWYGSRYSLEEAVSEGRAILIDSHSGQVIVGKMATQSAVDGELQSKENQDNSADSSPNASSHEEGTSPASADNQGVVAENKNGAKSLISIIVIDIGLNKEAIENALQLPKFVTLGVVPYANELEALIGKAREFDFEVLLNLPMQSGELNRSDPGPHALLNTLSAVENMKHLEWVLSRSDQVIGVYSSVNEVYTSTIENITPLLAELKKKNLAFVYGGNANAEQISNISHATGTKLAMVDLVLDDMVEFNTIRNNLTKLQSKAYANGYAVGVMHAYPVSIKALNGWFAEVSKSQDLVFISLSQLLATMAHLESKKVVAEPQLKPESPLLDNKSKQLTPGPNSIVETSASTIPYRQAMYDEY